MSSEFHGGVMDVAGAIVNNRAGCSK